MNWFQDRCFPAPLLGMLAGYEGPRSRHSFLAHDNRFSLTTPDHEWVATLAADESPPVVLTADERLFKDATNRAAVKASRLTYFCLVQSTIKGQKVDEYAWKLMKLWPTMVRHAEEQPAPTIYMVRLASSPCVELHRSTAQG